MDPDNRFGTLSDITIIDLTQMLAGPYGTMMLADHGARVIKVESPTGDMTRDPAEPDGSGNRLGGYFQSIDRNKDSVVLDLKTESGGAAFKALVRSADAVVENFRSGVMERLGLGYEVLSKINPRLVYGTLRGFGDPRTALSPYQDWPAFDVIAQAMGGIMAITGPNAKTPTKVGPGVGDIVPGMMLAFGVLAAIHHARRTGQGQFVDVAMADAVFNIGRSSALTAALLEGRPDMLRDAMEDRLHQPYRAPLIPGMDRIIEALSGYPDIGVALSGAGPSILCLVARSKATEYVEFIKGVLAEGRDYAAVPLEFDLEGVTVKN
jgi:crotonobetainyl-CoA:carnitine CoA-transferase CaiB-like acyl-CoA transferase